MLESGLLAPPAKSPPEKHSKSNKIDFLFSGSVHSIFKKSHHKFNKIGGITKVSEFLVIPSSNGENFKN